MQNTKILLALWQKAQRYKIGGANVENRFLHGLLSPKRYLWDAPASAGIYLLRKTQIVHRKPVLTYAIISNRYKFQ
jgi:hypothetical protein